MPGAKDTWQRPTADLGLRFGACDALVSSSVHGVRTPSEHGCRKDKGNPWEAAGQMWELNAEASVLSERRKMSKQNEGTEITYFG